MESIKIVIPKTFIKLFYQMPGYDVAYNSVTLLNGMTKMQSMFQ